MDIDGSIVDDNGTDQGEAREMLQSLCDNGFDGDDERAGQVLGRPAREIREMLSGDVDIDDDLAVKECGIAEELGIAI